MTATAQTFRALHQARSRPLLLANVWDALSARLVEESGAEALATASAAVSWVHGQRDGQHLPLPQLVANVRSIARCVQLPLSVDLERGYHTEPAGVADAVARVVEAGAVGVNLEDGGGPAELLADKIAAVRGQLGTDVFINARCCLLLHGRAVSVAELLRRARLWAEAGSDGVFVPRLVERVAIAELARNCPLPLNVLLDPALPALPELTGLGVRRVSVGPWLAGVAGAALKSAASAFLQQGDATSVAALTYPELNGLFAPG